MDTLMNAAPLKLDILAPLSGVLVPLECVPDPVFAQKMVGDGVSLDPTSAELLAPVDGIVTHLHGALHALTITTGSGIEVLIHIGVDTVLLKGEGFKPLVKQGERVRAGQALIAFDADLVAGRARSLLTQVLIANGENLARLTARSGQVQAGRDVILSLELLESAASGVARSADTGGADVYSEPVSLPNPGGLHARPAAVLAAAAKKFKSDIRLIRGADEANAKSVVAIMVLSTRQHDSLRVKASGPDAAVAASALTRMLAEGCGETSSAQAPVAGEARRQAPALPTSPATCDDKELTGVAASPGLAVGRIFQLRQESIEVSETGKDAQHERTRLDAALHEARQQIEVLKSRLADPAKAQILDAHQELLEDPDLIDLAIAGLNGNRSAGFAWRAAYVSYSSQLAQLDNPLLRERAADIRDVGRRVLAILAGVGQTRLVVPEGSILIAEELTPSDTASLDRCRVLGFCTTGGGATSHVAILARSLGIPAVCGIAEAALSLENGTLVVLDGGRGRLRRDPSEADLDQARTRMTRQAERREQERAAAGAPAITSDGHRIEVVANVRNAEETREAVAMGGEGVGLLRSEFLFSDRDSAPSEEEQAAAYQAVAEALGRERPLVIRTLDVGGDKPLSYLPLGKEDNPFLGLRGIRVSLERPDLFRTQLRAILRAAPFGNLHIMFPMIATLDELRAAKRILAEEQQATGLEAKIGVMIEVPSAAVTADLLAPEIDFFSIGTNDLTQYTLAMDRGHPKLAAQADALHPAVLKLIAMTVASAHRHGKWVGVCGGIAGDAMAIPVLIGLGVDELSVPVPAIPAVKGIVNRLSFGECQALAEEVLKMGTAAMVRERLAAYAE